MSKRGTKKKMVAGGRVKTRLYGRRRRRRNSFSRNHGGIVGPFLSAGVFLFIPLLRNARSSELGVRCRKEKR